MQLNFNSKIVLFFFFCYLTYFTHCSDYSSRSYQRAHQPSIICKVGADSADGLRSWSLPPTSASWLLRLPSVGVAGVKPF